MKSRIEIIYLGAENLDLSTGHFIFLVKGERITVPIYTLVPWMSALNKFLINKKYKNIECFLSRECVANCLAMKYDALIVKRIAFDLKKDMPQYEYLSELVYKRFSEADRNEIIYL